MTLTLITHNAYWFQGAPSMWGEERVQAHPDVLAALISAYREFEPDFLCLQEVPSQEICDQVAVGLGMWAHYVQGGGRSDYGGAVLWRAGDGAVEDLTHTRVGDERIFERICQQLTTLVNGEPFVVVNLHLSSDRFAPQRRGEAMRLAELEALFGACSQPDLVVGDFNARADSAEYCAMSERGFLDCGSRLAANRRYAGKCIDYVWVRRDSAVNAEGLTVIGEEGSFELAGEPPVDLSDHPPVGVRLIW